MQSVYSGVYVMNKSVYQVDVYLPWAYLQWHQIQAWIDRGQCRRCSINSSGNNYTAVVEFDSRLQAQKFVRKFRSCCREV